MLNWRTFDLLKFEVFFYLFCLFTYFHFFPVFTCKYILTLKKAKAESALSLIYSCTVNGLIPLYIYIYRERERVREREKREREREREREISDDSMCHFI